MGQKGLVRRWARRSGLLEAMDILGKVEGLSFIYFTEGDVVRHHLVQRIIRAYDEHKQGDTEGKNGAPAHPERAGKHAPHRPLD